MANGKAIANPGRGRGGVQAEAEVEAKLREISVKVTRLNELTEEALTTPQWYLYAAGLGLFGLGIVVSAVLF